ncbi:MAG: GNAT family N-acetyltransferase [Verrucomicrobiales bacterium]|nr:GNAT family N-acetyltransferase [Verrucomicrobiales bacterium]
MRFDPATAPSSLSCCLRPATRADAPALLRLITALAEFEKLEPPDSAAQQRLVEDGFGPHPRFESWLAFADGQAEPVGYAVLFEMYSTFLARPTLFLEDLFVLPEFRRRGIGTALLQHCIRLAQERGCGRMEWTSLAWNVRAQRTYERLGARRLSEWLLYRLDRASIELHANGQTGNRSSST